MVNLCKQAGANLVLCQWGFDDEANHLLLKNSKKLTWSYLWFSLPSFSFVSRSSCCSLGWRRRDGTHRYCHRRWEILSFFHLRFVFICHPTCFAGRIVPRFQELTPTKLGHAGLVREISFGTTRDRMLVIEQCPNTKSVISRSLVSPASLIILTWFRAVTIFVRGGSQMIVDEAKRSLHDALCVTRNLIRDNRIVYGGGSCEISCGLAVAREADRVCSVLSFSTDSVLSLSSSFLPSFVFSFSVRRFGAVCNASFCRCFGFNSHCSSGQFGIACYWGMQVFVIVDTFFFISRFCVQSLAMAKSMQVQTNNPHIGIDCLQTGQPDMKQQRVFEHLFSKVQQFQLATQVWLWSFPSVLFVVFTARPDLLSCLGL